MQSMEYNSRFALLVFVATVLWADGGSAADVKLCHQFLSSDRARLSCYDRASGFQSVGQENADEDAGSSSAKPGNTQAEAPKPPSKWRVTTEISDIDDTTNVFMRLSSDDNIRGRFGASGPMRMHIACRENTTSLWIIFNGHHMSDYQYGTVTYRLDKTTARNKSMRESTDNQALGLWRGGSSIPFIKSMFGHEKMLIKATPYGESAVKATFTIAGLEDEISKLREACHW